MPWPREFDDPLPLPNGRALVTLRHAADHILALPAKTSAREDWQFAMKMLIDAADRGGIVEPPQVVSRDLVPIPRKNAPGRAASASRLGLRCKTGSGPSAATPPECILDGENQ